MVIRQHTILQCEGIRRRAGKAAGQDARPAQEITAIMAPGDGYARNGDIHTAGGGGINIENTVYLVRLINDCAA